MSTLFFKRVECFKDFYIRHCHIINIQYFNMLLLICIKLILFSFWFISSLRGIYSYFHLIPGGIRSRIDKWSFLELFIILFTLFMCLMFIEFIINQYLLNLQLCNGNFNFHLLGDNSSQSTSHTDSTNKGYLGKASDGAIMTAAVVGGMKMAQHYPSATGKVAVLLGSVTLRLF
uniref:hypothetical protein n=1 Tax=Poriella subacida TaxID=2872513 RepID=UPI003002B267|nr:hypothetical protein [Poriella subacida]